MGSSAGAPPPDADPVGDARRRLVAAEVQLIRLVTRPQGRGAESAAETELGAALDEWWEAKERESSGSLL
jgi:hypothetical protein